MAVFKVSGKDKKPITSSYIKEQVAQYSHCVIDVGAGDAKGSLKFARENPNIFVIALDSSFDAQNKTSNKASKKLEKGGANNLLCIYGNIKDAKDELESIADETRVLLPWGDLLTGIAEVSQEIVGALYTVAKNESDISIVINAEIWKENLPKHLSDLGAITPDFFIENSSRFEHLGIHIYEAHLMNLEEINDLDTTWSAKLMSSRKQADFVKATGVVKKNYRRHSE